MTEQNDESASHSSGVGRHVLLPELHARRRAGAGAAASGGLIYEDLVEALRELLMNPERVRELGKKGRESVVEYFSVETMARKMIPIYRDIQQND